MKLPHLLAALSLAAALSSPAPAWAGEGHDHGGAAPSAAGPALPRFAAVSEAFELVGVLDGRRITLYLDRAADNTPVTEARIELEIGAAKHIAQKHGEDAFEIVLAEAPTPGVLPVTATLTVGDEVDLLAGELDIHDEAPAEEAAHTHSWKAYAAWLVAALAGLAALAVLLRRLGTTRQGPAGGTV